MVPYYLSSAGSPCSEWWCAHIVLRGRPLWCSGFRSLCISACSLHKHRTVARSAGTAGTQGEASNRLTSACTGPTPALLWPSQSCWPEERISGRPVKDERLTCTFSFIWNDNGKVTVTYNIFRKVQALVVFQKKRKNKEQLTLPEARRSFWIDLVFLALL